MKAIIDDNGKLLLYRNGKYLVQFCKHDKERVCGDRCPLFVEDTFEDPKKTVLTCTNINLIFSISQDQRSSDRPVSLGAGERKYPQL